MSDFANATESDIVQHMIGEATWGAVTNVYAMVHSADPGEDGTANTLASFGGRQILSFAAESGGSAATDADVEWTNGSGGSETVTHVTLWDGAGSGDPPTGDVCLMVSALTASKAVPDTEVFRITSGSLTAAAD
jgi:hypothetical protein